MGSKLDNLELSCVGLRRHSFSAPARLSLERLEKATQSLGVRVASLSSLVSAQSLITDPAQTDTMRTCHGCHAPIDDYHKGFPTGADHCPLEHWSGCKEAIAQGIASWRPCPLDSEAEESEKEEMNDDLLKKVDASYLQVESDGDGLASREQHGGAGGSEQDPNKQVEPESSEEILEVETDDEDEKALRDLEATNVLLRTQKAKIEAENLTLNLQN